MIQIIDLGVNILLARKLAPEIFGTVALVNVFNNILQVFVTSGFSGALVQKKDADDLDFSSVFYFNITSCTILYAIMFLAAPFIASFYNRPELVSLTRVLCLTLIISGVKNIQNAYVSRYMLFKRFFFASLAGTLIAAVCSVILAYKGFGAWALVSLQLADMLIDTVVLWFTVKWRPRKAFSMDRLKAMLPFGSRILANNLLDRVYSNLRTLIIGKQYSSGDLAFFEKGRKYPQTIYNTIGTTLNSVLFSAISRVQDDKKRVLEMLHRTIQTIVYLEAPLLFGLAVCAKPVVRLILTDKWLPSVPYLRVFCIVVIMGSISAIAIQSIKSLGFGNDLIRVTLTEKIVGIIIILITMRISIEAIALGMLVSSLFNLVITVYTVQRKVGYSFSDLFRDIFPSILLAAFMSACVYGVSFLSLKDWQTLFLQIAAGGFIYIGLSIFFRVESFGFLLNSLKNLRKKSD